MNEPKLKSGQARILVVENDLRWRQDHLTNLTRWGYRAFLAEGQGQALLEDAVEKAKKHRCHLALVDMRLLDHYDRSDSSGLDLIPKLKPTESIIVTAYSSANVVRTALKERGAFDFIKKRRGREPLKQALEEALPLVCAAKKELQIEWLHGLSAQTIVSRLFPFDSGVPASQVNDMLALLFPQAKRLRVEALNNSLNPAKSALRVHSVVLKVYMDQRKQPDVVKIASIKDIEKESERYQNYIEGQLGANYFILLQKKVSLWDLGGARYNFLGTATKSLQSFSQHYVSSQSVSEITKPLKFFFKNLWGNYYLQKKPAHHHSLFVGYSNVWGTSWHKRVQTFAKQDKYLCYPALQQEFLNPVRWVMEKVGLSDEPDALPDASIIPHTQQAITHGDLHGDNLFVDHERAWVIDYERTGPGPILQDFVELEVNILNRLAQFQPEELPIFYQLVCHLINAILPDNTLPDALTHHPEASKALGVIKTLRQLAWQKAGPFEKREYLWGLLFDSVFSATLQAPDTKQHQALHERTLLLGSLLCERLEG